MREFEAAIVRDTGGFVRGTARLLIWRIPSAAVLMPDGSWQTFSEMEAIPYDAGFTIPAGAIEAMAEAIQSFQGHASHADTEARVLREVLKVEQARVDRVLFPPPFTGGNS